MATVLNQNFWYKSYLLEFKINGLLTDAFAFALPPQSEEFEFPQRTNETKTFGGVVVDDYGNDTVKINLSGSTVNQSLKIIYKSSLGIDYKTGEEEIFYLRDLLKKYGQAKYLQGKEVYLYALNGGFKKVTSNPKWWRVYTTNLQIKRSKDNPFAYNYTLQLSGAPEETKKKYNLNLVTNLSKQIKKILQTCKDTINSIQETVQKLYDIGMSYLTVPSQLIESINELGTVCNSSIQTYIDMLDGAFDSANNSIKDIMSLGDTVFNSANRIANVTLDVYNNCAEIKDQCKALDNYFSNVEDKWSSYFTQPILEKYSDTDGSEISDVTKKLSSNCLDLANNVVADVKKAVDSLGFSVISGDSDSDDQLIVTYGYQTVKIKDSDTWDQLAAEYYGDPAYGSIIAIFNGKKSTDEISIGDDIQIPYLNYASSLAGENEVYNTPDVKDNYGTDVYLDNNGNILFSNGDFKIKNGVENLVQSLLCRFSTMIGSRIRDEVYGIHVSVGDVANASSTLIDASIRQTMLADSRVASVENVEFSGVGDNLQVTVTYTDINGVKQSYGGMIG